MIFKIRVGYIHCIGSFTLMLACSGNVLKIFFAWYDSKLKKRKSRKWRTQNQNISLHIKKAQHWILKMKWRYTKKKNVLGWNLWRNRFFSPEFCSCWKCRHSERC